MSVKWRSTNSSFYIFFSNNAPPHEYVHYVFFSCWRILHVWRAKKKSIRILLYMRALRLCMYYDLPLCRIITTYVFLICHLLFQFVCLTVMETVQFLRRMTKLFSPFTRFISRNIKKYDFLRFFPKNSMIESWVRCYLARSERKIQWNAKYCGKSNISSLNSSQKTVWYFWIWLISSKIDSRNLKFL